MTFLRRLNRREIDIAVRQFMTNTDMPCKAEWGRPALGS
jgi:hypothetical protein